MAYDPTKDLFSTHSADSAAPARNAAPVTPHDANDLAIYAKAIYVGVSGDVTLIPVGAATDTGVLFKSVPIGWLPVQARRILATGTTASQIVALFG